MKKNLKKEKKNKMKVYKYDNITMIGLAKETRDKLMKLKHKYHFKSIDQLLRNMIREFEYQNMEPYEKYNN